MSKTSLLVALSITVAAIGAWFYLTKNHTSSAQEIPVIVFANHPALNATMAGVKSILQSYATVKEYNAQGDISIALQIAKQCAGNEPHVIIGIATPAAQAANKARDKETTVLGFAAVSDPHGAHLDTEPNIIGVADTPQLEPLIATMRKVFPKATKLGVIYSPSEINSSYAVERLEKIMAKTPIKLMVKGVNNASMVKIAAQELVDGGVDVIYVPLDNFMVSSLSILNLVASQHNIPLISNDPALIEQGIALAVGPDYEESGKQLGQLILDRLQGKTIAQPLQLATMQRTVLNKSLVDKMNIDTKAITAEIL